MSLLRKPSTCKCIGGYRCNGDSWRVIDRRDPPATSQLKCLTCGWKWWSDRKYVAKLPDHVEDCRSGMTDLDVVALVRSGQLSILANNERAVRVFRKQPSGTWKDLQVINRESNGSSYKFVTICGGGKKKKVALHRLVWMAA
ncbi:MAG: hypothetical protein AAF664_25340, partial [Planctomycetota bacterium]